MQQQVHDLIVGGLAEHFGLSDPTQNPDLRNIAESYGDSIFLVGICNGSIVATGALVRESKEVGRVIRMSVASTMRRRGIGSLMLDALIHEAVQHGYEHLVLETTADWTDANKFYLARGFQLVGIDRDRNEANYLLSLPA